MSGYGLCPICGDAPGSAKHIGTHTPEDVDFLPDPEEPIDPDEGDLEEETDEGPVWERQREVIQ